MAIGALSRQIYTFKFLDLNWGITITSALNAAETFELSRAPSVPIVMFTNHNDPIPIAQLPGANFFSKGPNLRVECMPRLVVTNFSYVPHFHYIGYTTLSITDTKKGVDVDICTFAIAVVVPAHFHPIPKDRIAHLN